MVRFQRALGLLADRRVKAKYSVPPLVDSIDVLVLLAQFKFRNPLHVSRGPSSIVSFFCSYSEHQLTAQTIPSIV